MTQEMIDIDKIVLADYNPRNISREELNSLKKSISEFGFVAPVLLNTNGNICVGGHQRIRAAKALGMSQVPVAWVTLDKDKEKALNLALNKIQGSWDDDKLAEILEALAESDGLDLSATGFSPDEISAIVGDKDDTKEMIEDPIATPLPKVATTKLGDLYVLGEHRLLCGDSTSAPAVATLMNNEKADMVFTDPPYGMEFQSNFREKTPQFDKIKNDDQVLVIAPILHANMKENSAAYVCTRWDVYPQWFAQFESLFAIRNCVVWYKKGGGLGDLEHTYSPNHEFLIVAHKGRAKIRVKRDADVWQIERDGFGIYEHPTQKPVALPGFAIQHHSDKGDLVLDLFLGSGSTLLACEQLGRKCYGMELDPKYCDLIVARWEKFTGKKAVLLKAK